MLPPVNLTFKGKTLSISDWARKLGLSKQALHARLVRNWPLAEALRPTLRKPGSRGYGRTLSDLQRGAMSALSSDRNWHPSAAFVPKDLSKSRRADLLRVLTRRGFIERRRDGLKQLYRLTPLGRKALVRAPGPLRFVGANQPKRARARPTPRRDATAAKIP